MTHINDPLTIESTVPVVSRGRKGNSLRFWLLLGGSSLLFHGGILLWFGRFTPSGSAGAGLEAFMPIEWVTLPSDAALPQAASTLDSMEPPPAQPQASAAPSMPSAVPPSSGLKPNAPESNISVWSTQASLTALQFDDPLAELPIEPSPAEPLVTEPPPVKPQPHQPEPTAPAATPATPAAKSAEPAASPSPLNSPAPGASSSAPSPPPALSQSNIQPNSEATPESSPDQQALESQLGSQSETHQVAIRPLDPSSPQPLSLDFQPIEEPVPDVSGALPTESNPDMEADRVTAEIVVPSHLTASLTTIEPLPPEQTDLQVDESAYPKTEQHTFSSSPDAPCVVMQEAVRSLGQEVSMQVTTDELGQVVNTVTQKSSQNQAYDELATCLIKNWEFSPAIAEGQPIETNSLMVRITIEAEVEAEG